jgi:hypothetical protein
MNIFPATNSMATAMASNIWSLLKSFALVALIWFQFQILVQETESQLT